MDDQCFQVVCEYETGIKRISRPLRQREAVALIDQWRDQEPATAELRIVPLRLAVEAFLDEHFRVTEVEFVPYG